MNLETACIALVVTLTIAVVLFLVLWCENCNLSIKNARLREGIALALDWMEDRDTAKGILRAALEDER